ncbi:MAG: DUF4388 domain-containing protein [Myxococcota bacterium]
MTQPSSLAAPASGAPPSSRPTKVLVVDDSSTVLKVVHTILHLNGYHVHTARDGMEGFDVVAREGPFDLVLLDFVMPRMNGYQFCRKLRADANHKDTPVVLMSARTTTIGDRFVQQTGALDALDKPFDARALVAVVQSVLSRRAAPRSVPDPAAMLGEEHLSEAPDSVAPPSRHLRSLNRVGTIVGRAAGPSVASLSATDRQREGAVVETIANAIDETVVVDIARAIDEMDIRPDPHEVLRGQLPNIAVAEVLQFMQLGRSTGVMRVRNRAQSVTLFVREGALELAQSSGTDDEFRIGRYFVETNWMRRKDIESELVIASREGRLLGEHLVARGHIDEDKLRRALAKQSSELVYELLRWPEGRFVFRHEGFNEEAEKASLGLGLGELVFEGFRRVDEWRHMADAIDFEAVLVVNDAALGTLDDAKIGKSERKVLMSVDGERTTRDVMEATELASFDAIKAIYGFLQARIVRERGKLGATGAHAAAEPSATGARDELGGTGAQAPPDRGSAGGRPKRTTKGGAKPSGAGPGVTGAGKG